MGRIRIRFRIREHGFDGSGLIRKKNLRIRNTAKIDT